MAARRARLIVTSVTISGLGCGMAALGTADPDWAEFPWALIIEPAFVAGVPVLVFVASLASRRLGILAALLCATPMFMLAGAPPAGIVGATIFFGVALAIGMIGFVAAVAVDGVAPGARP